MLKIIGILFLVLISTVGISQEVNPTGNWQVYDVFDGIQVEYKLDNCTGVQGVNGNEVKLVLKFINTTNTLKTLTWRPQWYRDGICVNCQNINSDEFNFMLALNAGETNEGSACNKDKRFYMFSHWKNRVQGMDEKRLTSFDFVNPEVK